MQHFHNNTAADLEKFAINSYPTCILIGTDGNCIWRGHPAEGDLQNAIDKALGSAGDVTAAGDSTTPVVKEEKKATMGAVANQKIQDFLDDGKMNDSHNKA